MHGQAEQGGKAGEGGAAQSAAATQPVVATIRRRDISDPLRAAVQEIVATRVESDPAPYLATYRQLEQSFGGRYISADLFKEVIPEYSHSAATRNQFNTCVHNAAAVLSAMQLSAMLAVPPQPCRDTVMMLTGIPGAGKTSAILSMRDGDFPGELHAIFEGQLSNPETTRQKLDEVLQAGYRPLVVVVHPQPEQALRNTFRRFHDVGRGAGIGVMAEIQAGLPGCLAQVAATYGDTVGLEIIDRRDWTQTHSLSGWSNLDTLQSEGTHEQIKERLANELERARVAGEISNDCYRQALGRAPRGIHEGALVVPDVGQHHPNGHGPGLPRSDRQEALLAQPAALPFPLFLDGQRYALRLPDTQTGHYSGPVLWADGRATALHSIGRDRTLVMHDTRAWAQQPRAGESLEVRYRDGAMLARASAREHVALDR